MAKKEQHLFETDIFCNIINVFTITFDQFNESLLKICLKKYLINPQI